MRWILAATFLLGFTDAEQSQAFEAWGFKSGITQQEAITVAEGQGYMLFPQRVPSAIGFQNLSFMPKDRASDGTLNLNEYGLAFCNGHLVSIFLQYKPTMGNLMDIMESLTHIYGVPTVEASAQMLNDGRLRSMRFIFRPKRDDNVSVVINGSQHSEIEFGIQVFHDVVFRCAEQK